MRRAPRWLKLFLLGVITALAMPPINLWLAFAVAVPLFLHDVNRTAQGFWPGWLFGFGYFCFALHWIGFAFLVEAATYLWMMPFAVGGLAAFLAIYWGLATAAATFFERRFNAPLWLTLPAFLAAGEMLRGRLFTGFPWAAPGLAADGMGGVLQLASIIGMEGLTLLILLWAATPFVLLRQSSKLSKAIALIILALLPVTSLWGVMRLNANPTQFDDKVVVRLVQPNVLQSAKWNRDEAVRIFNTLTELSRSETATHIIWPESSIPFLIDESDEGKARIGVMLSPQQTLIGGVIRRSAPQASADYFTSVLVFDHDGEVIGIYDKWRLVPGGEFLPLEWLLEPLGFKKLVTTPGGFKWGRGPHTLPIPNGASAGLLICYEVIFPNQLTDAENPPGWLINVTNDGWFGNSTGPRQHLAQARLRAVEQGLPLVRAANTGISAVIDPLGRIIASTGIDEQVAIEARLPSAKAVTALRGGQSIVTVVLLALTLVFATTLAPKLH